MIAEYLARMLTSSTYGRCDAVRIRRVVVGMQYNLPKRGVPASFEMRLGQPSRVVMIHMLSGFLVHAIDVRIDPEDGFVPLTCGEPFPSEVLTRLISEVTGTTLRITASRAKLRSKPRLVIRARRLGIGHPRVRFEAPQHYFVRGPLATAVTCMQGWNT